MRSLDEIIELLPLLESQIADDLEGQDLDFKQWDLSSMNKSVSLVVKMAICFANGGGGTVVFGVADNVIGRSKAILGVPAEVDINLLKQTVYNKTDPKITPVFEELRVPEGHQRLIVMQIYPGMPPHTDTAGSGTIRVGKDCQPLTGTMRRKIGVVTGESDFTAETIPGDVHNYLSHVALEIVRNLARKENAPESLLHLTDLDFLEKLDLIKGKKITRAGLLIAGNKASLLQYFPGFNWTYLKMDSDTRYSNRVDDNDPIPVAVSRIEELISAHNPITTLEYGLFHFEYRVYPATALREALLNAFCHADFHINAPIIIKHFPDRLEISNPGGFIGGINPSNILHHQPVPRNPALINSLLKMRLVNRSNLGISRMYEALLIEGKEPPRINESGESVCVSFMHREFSPSFRALVEKSNKNGRPLGVDELIILQYLLHHAEGETCNLAVLCQRDEARIKDILSKMEQHELIERGGTGRGTYWTLKPKVHELLAAPGHPERDRRIDWEAAKTRVLSILMERSKRKENGMTNKEIRQVTHYNRQQVTRLINQLRKEHAQIQIEGHGAGTRYIWRGKAYPQN